MGRFDNQLEPFNLADEAIIDCGTFKVIIRPMDMANQDYRKAVTDVGRASSKNSVVGKTGQSDDIRVFCETVLVGWEDLKDDNTGELVPFSPEVAYELLTDGKSGERLYGKLYIAAAQEDTFRAVLEKNS